MKKTAHGLFAATLLTLGAGVAVVSSSPASAFDAGPLAGVRNNENLGSTGTNQSGIQVTAPGPCDPAATRHVLKVLHITPKNSADQTAADTWAGDNLYAPVGVNLPGPLTVFSNGSIQQVADSVGQQIVAGTWDLELRCQSNLGNIIYEQWSGTVIFDSPTAWHVPAQTPPTTTTTTTTTTSPTPSTTTTTTTSSTSSTTTATTTGTTSGTTTATTSGTTTATTSTTTPTTTGGITATLDGEPLADGAELAPGDVVELEANGFAAGEGVTVTLASVPQLLTTLTADADGMVTYTFTVPSTIEAGAHSLTFAGAASSVTEVFAFAVADDAVPADPSEGGLALTGAAVGTTAGVGALLVLGGASLMVASRLRSRRAHAKH